MFKLAALPFSPEAVSGLLSKETFDFHYGKHHQTYVDKLNELLPGSGFEKSTLIEIVKKSEGAIFNNAAQAWNHAFYWLSIADTKHKGSCDSFPELKTALEASFGSLDAFRTQFGQAAKTLFGSGWAWLVRDEQSGKLRIVQTKDAENPVRQGLRPLLVCDVWEHAYYIDYRNNRAKYVDTFLDSIHWAFADRNLKASGRCEISELMAR